MFETSTTSRKPWSGYWWPYLQNNGWNMYSNNGPLDKYDKYVQSTRGFNPQSQEFEAANFRTTNKNTSWYGHCQGLVAAQMLTPNAPAGGVWRNGIHFTQDDLEGLVTELYSNPTYTWLSGNRAISDDPNTMAFKDMDPAWMDYLMRYYVGQHKYPIAMDVVTGAQVWNYPAYAYTRNAVDNGNGTQSVRMKVWFSDAATGAATTRPLTKTYSYTMNNDGSNAYWTGKSVNNHPDFAWLPTGRAQPLNPRIDPAIISEILGYRV